MHVCCSLLRTPGEGSVHCDSGRSPTGTRSRCTRPPPTVRWSDTPSPGAGTTPSILRKQKNKNKTKKKFFLTIVEPAGDGWRTASLYLRSRGSISRDASLVFVRRCKLWADTPQCCTRCDPARKTKKPPLKIESAKTKFLSSLWSGFHLNEKVLNDHAAIQPRQKLC